MNADHTGDFGDFVASQAQHMTRTAWLLTGQTQSAEDLVQDTLVKVFVRWKRVSSADDPARYARAVMLNTFISGKRKRSSTEHTTAFVFEAVYESDNATRVDLLRALAALDRLDRTVIVLRYFDDMAPPDIARHLGLSPGAVRTRLSRALRKVRPLLDGYAPETEASGPSEPGGSPDHAVSERRLVTCALDTTTDEEHS